jgi:hypothetical protein
MADTAVVPFSATSLAELDNVVVEDMNIPTLAKFAAAKLGKTFPNGVKPSVKWLVEKGGVSKDALKPIRKELDSLRVQSYRAFHNINLWFAGSAKHRKSMKFGRNKKGQVWANTQYRETAGVSQATVDALMQELETLRAQATKNAQALPA